ncbi:plasmid replication protein [Listeria monocytogenes]|nr:plasmid replication protein [Listeria monocytogenes]
MKKDFSETDTYLYSAVISATVKEGLTAFRKQKSNGVLAIQDYYSKLESESSNRKGVQFVVRQKEDLQRDKGACGYIVTSQEALIEAANKISHWTPNAYRWGTYSDSQRKYIKGHSEENLQQINTYVIDIDTLNIDVAKMIMASIKLLNQTPTYILKTQKGFQMYFVLEIPVFVSNANNFKSLRVAKRIATNLKHAFAEHLPGVDQGCNDFGFFRAPNTSNVVFEKLNSQFVFKDLINWSKQYSINNNRQGLKLVKNSGLEKTYDATTQKWYRDLANLTNVKGHKNQYGRNNTIFTLALACYSAGKSYEETYNELDVFNSNLKHSVSNRELEKCIANAYSGKYKGAELEKVTAILQTYTNSDYEISYSKTIIYDETGKVKPQFYRKHKKERAERKYSHMQEWEADLEKYIEKEILSGQIFIAKSQREIAEEAKIPYATLKKLLKKSKRILSRIEGSGRSAKTLLSTVAIVVEAAIRHAMTKKQEQSEKYIRFLATFTEAENYLMHNIKNKYHSTSTGSAILEALPSGYSPGQQMFLLLEKVYQTGYTDRLKRIEGS